MYFLSKTLCSLCSHISITSQLILKIQINHKQQARCFSSRNEIILTTHFSICQAENKKTLAFDLV